MTDDGHISDQDLRRYLLGMVIQEEVLAPLEEHFLVCGQCLERAERNEAYVPRLRAALEFRVAQRKGA